MVVPSYSTAILPAFENKILTLVATNVQTRQQLENYTPALIKLKFQKWFVLRRRKKNNKKKE